MRVQIIGATLLVAVLASGTVACSSSGDDDETAATTTTATADASTTTTTAPAPLDESQLEATLLTVDDLPDGFTEQPAGDSSEENSSLCDDLNPSTEVPPEARTHAQFIADPNNGPVIQSAAGSYENEDTASAFIQAVNDDVAQCSDPYDLTGTDGSTLTYAAQALDLPTIGDESVAIQFNVTGGPAPVVIDVIDARTADVVFQVAEVSAADIDLNALQQLAATQLDRTEAALG